MRGEGSSVACRAGRRAAGGGGGRLFPDAASSCSLSATWSHRRAAAAGLDDVGAGQSTSSSAPSSSPRATISPKLNLVGIVDADLGLANGDPRAAERNVPTAASSCRARRPRGRPRLWFPADAPARTSGDARADRAGSRGVLLRGDRGARSAYPPFGRLASLLISGADSPPAEAFARRLAAVAPHPREVRVLGPAEAPLAVVRGRHRFRLLVKSPRAFDLSAYLREWLAAGPRQRASSSSRSMSIRRVFSTRVKVPCANCQGGGVFRRMSRGDGVQQSDIRLPVPPDHPGALFQLAESGCTTPSWSLPASFSISRVGGSRFSWF